MKKVFVLVSCFAVVLIVSNMSFAQSEDAPVPLEPQLSVENIIGEVQPDGVTVWRHLHPAPAVPQVLPFGYPPYPTVDGHPAYGIPYSYPRAPRRLGARLTPPPFQPHPLPVPGAVPGAAQPPVFPMMAPPMVMGQVPVQQGVLGMAGSAPVVPQGPPTVVYRPTPIKNFVTLMTAPRPYIGYDPYAGYPLFPGYVPQQ